MEQTFIAGMAIGLCAGWMIELLIDFFYWRRGDSTEGVAGKQLSDANLSLATASQHITMLDGEMLELSTRNSALNASLSESRREIENLRAQLATIAAHEESSTFVFSDTPSDDLEEMMVEDMSPDAFKTAAAQTVRADDAFDLDAFKTAAAKVTA